MVTTASNMLLPRRDRGVALILVLWLVAALSVLVSALVATARTDLRGAQLVRLQVEHAALGDGAIRLAAAQLTIPQTMADPPREFHFTLDGQQVVVDVLPGSAFIDLNRAPVELLRDMFIYGGGIPPEEAEVMASRVIDWRDPDTAALPNGAEDPAYEAAGSPFRTRGGPFESVEDLIQVLGVEPDLYDKIKDLVGIYGATTVDPAFASAPVLNVLAAGRMDVVSRILAARSSRDPLVDSTGLNQQFSGRASARVFRLEAWCERDGRRLSRARWLDFGRPGRPGVPWKELSVEPVYSEEIQPGSAHGG